MKWTRALGYLVSSFAATTSRRLRGEPLVESWPFQFACVRGLLRRSLEDDIDRSPDAIRRSQEGLVPDPAHEVGRVETSLGGVDCEWFSAEPGAGAEPRPGSGAVVYLHGGGYIFGTTESYADLLGRLSRSAEVPVLGVNYRRCPENELEDAVDDAVSVFESLYERGWAPEALALAGDSAGGGLAVSSSVALRNRGLASPSALSLLSPWADMRCRGDSLDDNDDTDYLSREILEAGAALVRGGRPLDDPIASPVVADLGGLPPTSIYAGGAEVLLDDSRRLADRMETAGVDVTLEVLPDMPHVCHLFARYLPRAETAIDELGQCLRRAVDG